MTTLNAYQCIISSINDTFHIIQYHLATSFRLNFRWKIFFNRARLEVGKSQIKILQELSNTLTFRRQALFTLIICKHSCLKINTRCLKKFCFIRSFLIFFKKHYFFTFHFFSQSVGQFLNIIF